MARGLFVDPYAEQKVELLQEPAKARAAAIQQIANAQAQAATVTGNANANAAIAGGQAAGQAAQAIGGIPQQIQAYRQQSLQQQNVQSEIADRAQQAKLRDAQIQGIARDQAASAAGAAAIKSSVETDSETGLPTVNHAKAADLWEQAGFPTQANAYRESVQKTAQTAQQLTEGAQKIADGKRQAQQAAVDHLGQLGLIGIKAMDTQTPLEARDTTLGLVANAASHGLISEQDAQQFLMQSATAAPDQLRGIFQRLVDASPATKEQAVKDALTASETFKNTAAGRKDLIPPAKSLQSKSVLVDGKPAEVSYNPENGSYQIAGQAIDASRVKPIPPASMTINPALVPSGDALTQAARSYLATGQLPALGMGQAGMAARVAIMNEAAKIDPQASLAANKATFGADSANLKKLQTTEGTLSAFENTAGKNLDQFLTLAAKIPDTDVPWLNQPIRAVDASLLGSADQAAFNAARDVALREIARVTNDPKLSGALTDSARSEVASLSPATATFAQIQRVAKVLKQDMANVHAGINDQIATVKSGLHGNPAAPPPPAENWVRDASGKLIKQ